jgi:hypothetical protein
MIEKLRRRIIETLNTKHAQLCCEGIRVLAGLSGLHNKRKARPAPFTGMSLYKIQEIPGIARLKSAG